MRHVRGGELLAIEVKAADRYHTGLLKGLRAIADLPRLVRRILVYTGRRSFRSADGIEIWPARRFASTVAAGGLWPGAGSTADPAAGSHHGG